jgi:glyoxylase-like metal-dependent hydrolase (beta-lactamase superfamily II)
MIIIIDPGGEASHVKDVERVVAEALEEKRVPVFIFLTHCHTDHFYAMFPLLKTPVCGQLILHEIAARALETNDEHITQAKMIDLKLPECEVQARFFETSPSDFFDHPLSVEDVRTVLPDGQSVAAQSFFVSDRDVMYAFHTPGHSSDSISYILGSCLFSGDLHLATTPGIVGLIGWDSVRLVASLEFLEEMGRRMGIALVIPGHGVPFPFEKAEKVFNAVRREAVSLSNLEVLNRGRAEFLSEYVTVLLEEASSIFSIIAARLLKVSHYLEMLEEEECARDILQLVDAEAIERLVDDLYYFTEQVRQGAPPLILKAFQFVKSVDKMFEPDKIRHLFDPFLLGRLRSLLTDFVNAAYGIRFENQNDMFDMNISIRELLASVKANPLDTESFFNSLDDDSAFVKELSRRIAYEPIFSDIRFDYRPATRPILAYGNSELFQEAVSALLEQFAVCRVNHVHLACLPETERMVLQVTDDVSDSLLQLRDSKLSYLRHAMRMAGGSFQKTATGRITCYQFELPASRGL